MENQTSIFKYIGVAVALYFAYIFLLKPKVDAKDDGTGTGTGIGSQGAMDAATAAAKLAALKQQDPEDNNFLSTNPVDGGEFLIDTTTTGLKKTVANKDGSFTQFKVTKAKTKPEVQITNKLLYGINPFNQAEVSINEDSAPIIIVNSDKSKTTVTANKTLGIAETLHTNKLLSATNGFNGETVYINAEDTGRRITNSDGSISQIIINSDKTIATVLYTATLANQTAGLSDAQKLYINGLAVKLYRQLDTSNYLDRPTFQAVDALSDPELKEFKGRFWAACEAGGESRKSLYGWLERNDNRFDAGGGSHKYSLINLKSIMAKLVRLGINY